jgi:hypothetical protein
MMLVLVVAVSGCTKKTSNTNVDEEALRTQKIIIVAVDKETKAPLKEAKVYILGDETTYTTDEMGKTPEINAELNKSYFGKYGDEVTSRMRSGFINVVVVGEGYGKHLEADYCIYPGDSISVVKVELKKSKGYTVNLNNPDNSYIENLSKTYENFEAEAVNAENSVKYSFKVVDENNKPVDAVKVVIPEVKAAGKTDKKGACELSIPYEENVNAENIIKKDYNEITVLTYKEGYSSKAVLKAHICKDEKSNVLTIKMKKSSKPSVEFEMVKPDDKWVKELLDSYK